MMTTSWYSYTSTIFGTVLVVLCVIFDLDPVILMSAAAMIGSHFLVYDQGTTGRVPMTPYRPRNLSPMEQLNEEFLTTDMDSIDYVLKADKL